MPTKRDAPAAPPTLPTTTVVLNARHWAVGTTLALALGKLGGSKSERTIAYEVAWSGLAAQRRVKRLAPKRVGPSGEPGCYVTNMGEIGYPTGANVRKLGLVVRGRVVADPVADEGVGVAR